MNGPLHQFFAGDHRRLDAFLSAATLKPGAVDLEPFGRFRAGLLRHIGMEEKLLFPALRAARSEATEITARLRVDHGALTALLVPTPTPAIIEKILFVLGPHNRREEESEGVYALADDALGATEVERLLRQAEAFPEPPLKPYNDGPEVMKHVELTCDLSWHQWAGSDDRGA